MVLFGVSAGNIAVSGSKSGKSPKSETSRIKLDFIRVGLLLSASLIIAVWGFMAFSSSRPYSLITLDINPSIEIQLDRNNYVLSADAKNNDGKIILDTIVIKGMNVNSAISMIVNRAVVHGYISQGASANTVVLGAAGGNRLKTLELLKKVDDAVQNVLAENGIAAFVETAVLSQEYVKEAKEIGLSPGKLLIIENLAKTKGITNEEAVSLYKDARIKDIIKEEKAIQKSQTDERDKPYEITRSNGVAYSNGVANPNLVSTKPEVTKRQNEAGVIISKKSIEGSVAEKRPEGSMPEPDNNAQKDEKLFDNRDSDEIENEPSDEIKNEPSDEIENEPIETQKPVAVQEREKDNAQETNDIGIEMQENLENSVERSNINEPPVDIAPPDHGLAGGQHDGDGSFDSRDSDELKGNNSNKNGKEKTN